MRGPGLLTMLEIGAGLSIAGPMFVVALEFTRTGQFVFGTIMFALGLVAMFFPSYFLHRLLGRKSLFRRSLDRVKRATPVTDDAGSDPDTESDPDPEPEPERSSLLRRFRRFRR